MTNNNSPAPEIISIDLTPQGTLHTTNDQLPIVVQMIKAKIEHDPSRYSYPESFAEYVRHQFKNYAGEKVLVLRPDTVIDGDLVLDVSESWISTNKICAVVCEGDVTVTGDILNRTLESGVLFFVNGNLSVRNLIKGGATVMVLGDVSASGLVVGEYNDGVLRIGGDLAAAAYFLFDHDGFVRGSKPARSHNDDDGEWQELLVSDLFDDEDDWHPNVTKLWTFFRTKKEIFVSP